MLAVFARFARSAVVPAFAVGLAACSGQPVEGDGGASGSGSSQAAGAPSGGTGVISVAGQGTGGGESGAAGISASAGAGGAGAAAGAGTGASGGSNGVAGMAGESGGGTAGVALVGVFVAQGHQGRITRSCDDGLTFPYNHSADDAFVCFSDADHDCDHSAVAGRGLAFGSGSFVATWGWGHPGTVQRSTDGKVFSDVMTETPTFADIAFGNGVFVAGGNPTRISSDGSSWSMGGKLSFDFNYRGIEFVPTAGGMFIVAGESGDQRAISWSRDGKTWTAASERPDLCGQELRGVAGSDAVMIVVSGQGHVCRSTDGDTWTYATVTDRFTSPPLWTGSEFWAYSGAKLFKSSDGQAWSSQDIEPKNIAIGPLARSPQGTLVAANDGWQVWYDKQQFFRSTDGVHWDVLPKTAFTGSHPIYFMSFGYVPASAGCGLP